MSAAIIWILIATNLSAHSAPTVVARFTDEAACKNVAAQIVYQSYNYGGMDRIGAFCVGAADAKLLGAAR